MSDEDDFDSLTPFTGSLQTATGSDDEDPIGVIWLPDMEQRHGWRGHYIYPDHKRPERRVGFGRRP